jgi:hypothetical protein
MGRVVSFIIAQLIAVTLHYRATRLTHETEEIKFARELYREFYLQEKSYLQIAGAIESCQKLYKNDGGSLATWPSTNIWVFSPTSACSCSAGR